MKIANYVMLVAFVFGVIVQYNDPDPARWMAIYGAAALACGLYAAGRRQWIAPGIVLLVAVIWGGNACACGTGQSWIWRIV